MKSKYLIIFIVILLSCKKKDCKNISTSFKSYSAAKVELKKYSFKIQENTNTEQSSWIRSVEYLSCDGKVGFLVMRTDEQEYLHQNVPIKIWEEFKNSHSFGSFYNMKIKYKYQLSIK